MKTTTEFYAWCEEQKNIAIAMCEGNESLIAQIAKQVLPSANNFQVESGFMEAPGFKAKVLLMRAEDSISYNEGMTRLQNENKLYA